MQTAEKRGVLYGEHALPRSHLGRSLIGKLSDYPWKLCARVAFARAAEHLGMSVNVLRRRVDELEHSLGDDSCLPAMSMAFASPPKAKRSLLRPQKWKLRHMSFCRFASKPMPAFREKCAWLSRKGLGTFWIAPRSG